MDGIAPGHSAEQQDPGDRLRRWSFHAAREQAGFAGIRRGAFDIAFSLHSIYFWNDPLECLRGFRRVLNPGGLLAITIQPKDRWAKDRMEAPGMHLFLGDQVAELFSSAGFENVRTESFKADGEASLECIHWHEVTLS